MGYTTIVDASEFVGELLCHHIHRTKNTSRFFHRQGFKELEMGMSTFRAQATVSRHPALQLSHVKRNENKVADALPNEGVGKQTYFHA